MGNTSETCERFSGQERGIKRWGQEITPAPFLYFSPRNDIINLNIVYNWSWSAFSIISIISFL